MATSHESINTFLYTTHHILTCSQRVTAYTHVLVRTFLFVAISGDKDGGWDGQAAPAFYGIVWSVT